MEKITVNYIDCVGFNCKNLQTYNTIEIFFSVNAFDQFEISYSFHRVDFDIWKQVIEIHSQDVKNCFLINKDGVECNLTELINCEEYYTYKLVSTDFNLYRNINLILFNVYENGENTMDEEVYKNTWNV